jgi:hypothetical protein
MLVLEEDGSFTFSDRCCVCNFSCAGTWSQQGDVVALSLASWELKSAAGEGLPLGDAATAGGFVPGHGRLVVSHADADVFLVDDAIKDKVGVAYAEWTRIRSSGQK